MVFQKIHLGPCFPELTLRRLMLTLRRLMLSPCLFSLTVLAIGLELGTSALLVHTALGRPHAHLELRLLLRSLVASLEILIAGADRGVMVLFHALVDGLGSLLAHRTFSPHNLHRCHRCHQSPRARERRNTRPC